MAVVTGYNLPVWVWEACNILICNILKQRQNQPCPVVVIAAFTVLLLTKVYLRFPTHHTRWTFRSQLFCGTEREREREREKFYDWATFQLTNLSISALSSTDSHLAVSPSQRRITGLSSYCVDAHPCTRSHTQTNTLAHIHTHTHLHASLTYLRRHSIEELFL